MPRGLSLSYILQNVARGINASVDYGVLDNVIYHVLALLENRLRYISHHVLQLALLDPVRAH